MVFNKGQLKKFNNHFSAILKNAAEIETLFVEVEGDFRVNNEDMAAIHLCLFQCISKMSRFESSQIELIKKNKTQ